MRSTWLLKAFLIVTLPVIAAAKSLHVAVASNFRSTMEKVIVQYQQNHAAIITLSSASTGVLYAQIKQGAPFDIFFSADGLTAERLADELSLPSPMTYAIGNLALWCPSGAPQQAEHFFKWQGRYAQANPALAPYGAAAREATTFAGWSHSNQAISMNNVAQVAQLVFTGQVACGFIATSLIPKTTTKDAVFLVPESWYTPIEQKAVLLPTGLTKPLAREFLAYVQQQASTLIVESGYRAPTSGLVSP